MPGFGMAAVAAAFLLGACATAPGSPVSPRAWLAGENQVRDPDLVISSLGDASQYWDFISESPENSMTWDPGQSASGPGSLRLEIRGTGSVDWDPHVKLIGLDVEEGKTYTYSVFMKADRPVKVVFDTRRLHEETFFGFREAMVGTDWKEYSHTVTATQSNRGDVMVLTQLGFGPATLWIDHVRFYEGAYTPTTLSPPK